MAVEAPQAAWCERAQAFLQSCQKVLWGEAGRSAREELARRGLSAETIRAAQLGYNPHPWFDTRERWGLASGRNARGNERQAWLPLGIVIPWWVDGALWRVNIRRPAADLAGDPEARKYIQVSGGGASLLYNVDALHAARAAVLLESELDALTIWQEAWDLSSQWQRGRPVARVGHAGWGDWTSRRGCWSHSMMSRTVASGPPITGCGRWVDRSTGSRSGTIPMRCCKVGSACVPGLRLAWVSHR
jgi:DNA primase